MTRNLMLLISNYPRLAAILAGVVLLLGVFFISRCESNQQAKIERISARKVFVADSLIVNQQGVISVYKTLSQKSQDSILYWKNRYSQANTQQKQVIILHEKIKTAYARDYNINPDSARLGFLAKRFPNLYPQASPRRVNK